MSDFPEQLGPGQLRLDILASLESALKDVSEWADMKAALHTLWTKHVGTPGYDKREWGKLDRAIFAFARRMLQQGRIR
jgi:hypothetical protein